MSLLLVDDLRFQQRQDVRRKRGGVISDAICRLPNAIISGRLNRTQDKLRYECRVFGAARSAASCNFATPDENMELAKSGVLGGFGKPGHADSTRRGLQEATCRRANLFDRPL